MRWVLIAAATGFTASAVLTMALRLERHAFVAVWSGAVVALWTLFSRGTGARLRVQVTRRWPAGLVVGGLIGALLAATVARQPGSVPPAGAALAVDLGWLGVVYGSADALILAIIPVLALYRTRPGEQLRLPSVRLRVAGIALAGTALVTAAYHAGFREFQGPQLIQPVIGGLATAAAFLLSGSALGPIVAHVIMHIAAVLHGPATTVQLPPHY